MAGQERRIVVGVDGSGSSKAALRWAVHQAKLTGSSVEAVIVWQRPYIFGFAALLDGVDFEAIAKKALTEALAEMTGLEPGVKVRPVVTGGIVAEELLRAAEGADLLVVGSRGEGGCASALLGSVSLHCVQHAHCPVLVLHDGFEGYEGASGEQAEKTTAPGRTAGAATSQA